MVLAVVVDGSKTVVSEVVVGEDVVLETGIAATHSKNLMHMWACAHMQVHFYW